MHKEEALSVFYYYIMMYFNICIIYLLILGDYGFTMVDAIAMCR